MSTVVQVIGRNAYAELGNDIINSASQLTTCNIIKYSSNITEIVSGDDFAIYSDGNQNFWAAGYNKSNQYPIDQSSPTDTVFYPINFFKKRNIKIKKVCTNTRSLCLFWITESGYVYAHGWNNCNQIGITEHNDTTATIDISQPTLIPGLNDVIDIQSTRSYSIALCSNRSENVPIIIQFWCRIYHLEIPDDITNIFVEYHRINQVLSVGRSGVGSHGHGNVLQVKKWTVIDALKDRHIIKVGVGFYHSLFLDSEGIVWCCGGNESGQCGVALRAHDGGRSAVHNIQSIDFFIENEIRIKDIACGSYFSMVVDADGRLWGFGDDMYGQICGSNDIESSFQVLEPKELNVFGDGIKAEIVKCGAQHCYVRCNGGRHYLWGDNEYNECLVFGEGKTVRHPRLIAIKGMCVRDVFLGSDNTKIIVYG